jgi:hypothetical protein
VGCQHQAPNTQQKTKKAAQYTQHAVYIPQPAARSPQPVGGQLLSPLRPNKPIVDLGPPTAPTARTAGGRRPASCGAGEGRQGTGRMRHGRRCGGDATRSHLSAAVAIARYPPAARRRDSKSAPVPQRPQPQLQLRGHFVLFQQKQKAPDQGGTSCHKSRLFRTFAPNTSTARQAFRGTADGVSSAW